jgi:outer membrane protein OmpA-like peptidoglycan-associated protein
MPRHDLRGIVMHRAALAFLICCALTATHAAHAQTQRFDVYFQEWSAGFDDPAQAVISQAADYAKQHPGVRLRVSGFADPTGSKAANVLLADLRAQRVVDQLQTDGIPGSRIQRRGHGPVQFAMSSQESRRVEISAGDR